MYTDYLPTTARTSLLAMSECIDAATDRYPACRPILVWTAVVYSSTSQRNWDLSNVRTKVIAYRKRPWIQLSYVALCSRIRCFPADSAFFESRRTVYESAKMLSFLTWSSSTFVYSFPYYGATTSLAGRSSEPCSTRGVSSS